MLLSLSSALLQRALHGTQMANITNIPHSSDGNALTVRIFACCMSSLSIFGALLIMLSYICFKNIRTKAREVLFHLSVADFGVGSTNLIGAIVDYDDIIDKCRNHSSVLFSCHTYVSLCKTQAFFAQFFTLSSILWTLLLALYVYTLVLDSSRKLSFSIVRFGYLVCWGMPIFLSIWFVLTKKLGKTKIGGAGWCSLKAENREGNVNHFAVFFGNDIWVMSTFFLILVLYTTLHCHLRDRVSICYCYNCVKVFSKQTIQSISNVYKTLLFMICNKIE